MGSLYAEAISPIAFLRDEFVQFRQRNFAVQGIVLLTSVITTVSYGTVEKVPLKYKQRRLAEGDAAEQARDERASLKISPRKSRP